LVREEGGAEGPECAWGEAQDSDGGFVHEGAGGVPSMAVSGTCWLIDGLLHGE
jgi:hypothetical protein